MFDTGLHVLNMVYKMQILSYKQRKYIYNYMLQDVYQNPICSYTHFYTLNNS